MTDSVPWMKVYGDPLLLTPWWSVTGGYVCLSLKVSQGDTSTREKEFTSWCQVGGVCTFFIFNVGKDWRFCPILLYPKFARVWFLSRDWILKLDPMLILDSNSKFRNYLLNLDIHNFTLVPHKLSPHKLGYPFVMPPLGNALTIVRVILVYVCPHYSKVKRVYGM